MKKMVLVGLLLGFFLTGIVQADEFEAELTAGNTSVQGGGHFKRSTANGFWKAGGSILYTDDDETEYKWVQLDFLVGSDQLQPGLTGEVGVRGISGDAEENRYSGDVGAMAFVGQISYVFPQAMMPIPLELFGGITYAPEIMSFADTEKYMALELGIGVRIVPNASVILRYTAYDVDMESGPGDWDLDDDVIRLGVSMRF